MPLIAFEIAAATLPRSGPRVLVSPTVVLSSAPRNERPAAGEAESSDPRTSCSAILAATGSAVWNTRPEGIKSPSEPARRRGWRRGRPPDAWEQSRPCKGRTRPTVDHKQFDRGVSSDARTGDSGGRGH